jgi:hypothetical protein
VKNTILVTVTNRGATKHTRRMWRSITAAGAMHLEQEGSPDIAFARNQALSAACDALRQFETVDTILLCDDDMIGPLESVQKLIDASRSSGRPCSVVYATQDAHLAGTRWRIAGEIQRDETGRSLWMVGMGLVAVPRERLLKLESETPSFKLLGKVYSAFCETGVVDGQWIAEDYHFCMRIGGVRLEPIAFGHIKTTPLWPDGETIEAVGSDAELPGEEKDTIHVRHSDQLYPGEVDNAELRKAAE